MAVAPFVAAADDAVRRQRKRKVKADGRGGGQIHALKFSPSPLGVLDAMDDEAAPVPQLLLSSPFCLFFFGFFGWMPL